MLPKTFPSRPVCATYLIVNAKIVAFDPERTNGDIVNGIAALILRF